MKTSSSEGVLLLRRLVMIKMGRGTTTGRFQMLRYTSTWASARSSCPKLELCTQGWRAFCAHSPRKLWRGISGWKTGVMRLRVSPPAHRRRIRCHHVVHPTPGTVAAGAKNGRHHPSRRTGRRLQGSLFQDRGGLIHRGARPNAPLICVGRRQRCRMLLRP